MTPVSREGFGLYIHWPFCLSKCPYCDFNSHVRHQIDEEIWSKALCMELDHVGVLTRDRTLTSVFFGGGTPSLMSPQTVGTLLNRLSRHWRISSDLEVTLEANPNSAERQKFQDLKKAGVNRLSIGIQALNDADLGFLGRRHTRQEALEALTLTLDLFERFSFDLIYARPSQTLFQWKAELSEALTYARDHLSLYQLTLEPGTAFYTACQRGEWQLPDAERAADLYEVTHEILQGKGLLSYEVSNYARPGEECRHNLVYWRYEDYAAVGPGAHGRLSVEGQLYALKRFRAPETWLQAVQKQGHGTETWRAIFVKEHLIECLMMGLRLSEGIDLHRFQKTFGQPLTDFFSLSVLDPLIEENLLCLSPDRLRATSRGRQTLNTLLHYILDRATFSEVS